MGRHNSMVASLSLICAQTMIAIMNSMNFRMTHILLLTHLLPLRALAPSLDQPKRAGVAGTCGLCLRYARVWAKKIQLALVALYIGGKTGPPCRPRGLQKQYHSRGSSVLTHYPSKSETVTTTRIENPVETGANPFPLAPDASKSSR